MGFVTQSIYDRSLNVGFNLPEAQLTTNTAEQIAVFTVVPGQLASLRWLNLHLVSLNSSVAAIPVKINPSLGAVYAALYGDRADLITAAAGRPLCYVPVDLPGAAAALPAYTLNLSPGAYSVLVMNNLRGTTVTVSACGAYSITLP